MLDRIIDKFVSNQFDVVIGINSDDIFDVARQQVVKRIYSSRSFFASNPVVIIADPFLFVKDDVLYLFYEEQVGFSGKGIIKVISTIDMAHWTKPKVVLSEPFHLSYPNVFEVDGVKYMMPETGSQLSIRLYCATGRLDEWRHIGTLAEGEAFVDSSVVRVADCYYLFTTVRRASGDELWLYSSDSFPGRWEKHPCSPIRKGDGVRCAGPVFASGDSMYRPAQRHDGYYGSGVDIFRIDTITPDRYEETLFREKIIPCSDKCYKAGGHHINSVGFNGKTIVATDCVVRRMKFFEICKRIIGKLK